MKPKYWARQRAIAKKEIARQAWPWYLAYSGITARRTGQSPCACPYVLGTANQRAWFNGWALAGDDE